MNLLSKNKFNFSNSLFKSLGYSKYPSIKEYDYNIPEIESILEKNKEHLFKAKSNLGFCRRLQNLLFANGLNICYTHSNPWSADSFDVSGCYMKFFSDDVIEIVLHMNAEENTFKENWENIKFELFAAITHETIHLIRAKRKEFNTHKILATERDLNMSTRLAAEREYLSDIEEIYAYAIQILMEESYYGESRTLSRYYRAFGNKKLNCAKKVLLGLHSLMEKNKKEIPMFN
jgi:hypothetical protein